MGCGSLPYPTDNFQINKYDNCRTNYGSLDRLYIKNKKVDYIICHDQLAGVAGDYAFKKFGIKYSVFVHERLSSNNSILGKLWHNYEHKVLEKAVNVFSITEKVAKTVEKIQNIKSAANYLGMDIQEIKEFHKKENALIAVAMWDEGRKPEFYLDIIEQILDFSLYFVGNFRIKELENKFKEEIKKRNLEKKGYNETWYNGIGTFRIVSNM